MTNIASNITRVFLLLGLLTVVPAMASAEWTDLQEGARGTIVQPRSQTGEGIHTGHTTGPVVISQPGQEGTDLQTNSRGNIDRPSGVYKEKTLHRGVGNAVPEQSPDLEGTDLQNDARGSIK